MLQQGGAKPTRDRIHAAAGDLRRAGERARQAWPSASARPRPCARVSPAATRRAQFAKGLIDVTVRDLGRKLAPELPPDWAEQIKKTKVGGATPVRETARGVEFIGVCSAREVSDDRVAKMVFQTEGTDSGDQGRRRAQQEIHRRTARDRPRSYEPLTRSCRGARRMAATSIDGLPPLRDVIERHGLQAKQGARAEFPARPQPHRQDRARGRRLAQTHRHRGRARPRRADARAADARREARHRHRARRTLPAGAGRDRRRTIRAGSR